MQVSSPQFKHARDFSSSDKFPLNEVNKYPTKKSASELTWFLQNAGMTEKSSNGKGDGP